MESESTVLGSCLGSVSQQWCVCVGTSVRGYVRDTSVCGTCVELMPTVSTCVDVGADTCEGYGVVGRLARVRVSGCPGPGGDGGRGGPVRGRPFLPRSGTRRGGL